VSFTPTANAALEILAQGSSEYDSVSAGKKVELFIYRPEQVHQGFRRLRLPEFLDNLYMKTVRLSVPRTGRLHPRG
jgi:hypothetical protein